MPKIHEIIVMQMLDDDRFRSSINEALAKAGVEVTIPGRTPVEPAAPYTTPPQPALSASSWRMLTADELIQDGDQWAPLKEPDRWRPVGDSVGTCPSNWTKSHFRRMVGVDQMAVTERVIPGGKTVINTWTGLYAMVGKLLWVQDTSVNNTVREIAILKSVNMHSSATFETLTGTKVLMPTFVCYTLDHDEQWMIGMHCEMGDVRWENRTRPPQRGLLREISGGPHYRFINHWKYCRIDEDYYRQSIGSVCRSAAQTPIHDDECIDDPVPAISLDPRFPLDGEMVWIGDEEHHELAICRGVETGDFTVLKCDTVEGRKFDVGFIRLSDAPKHWLVGYECFYSDDHTRISRNDINHAVVTEIDESRPCTFKTGNYGWLYARIAEPYYRTKIAEAMASHSAMNEPQEIQPTEVLPRLRIYAGESLRGVVIGDLVWIGEDPHPAIFRGLLTGSDEFSFDTENGVERARWFVRLEDADPAWLVGHTCRCSDVNNVPLDTSPFVRIVRYIEGDMFPFRETSNAWRYGRIDESYYINLISEAMINLAVDQRIEQEAPL